MFATRGERESFVVHILIGEYKGGDFGEDTRTTRMNSPFIGTPRISWVNMHLIYTYLP